MLNQARHTADHLTKAQRAWLVKWTAGDKGFRCPYVGGFEAVTWKRMAARMTKEAILRDHYDGEVILTDYGLRVMQWVTK